VTLASCEGRGSAQRDDERPFGAADLTAAAAVVQRYEEAFARAEPTSIAALWSGGDDVILADWRGRLAASPSEVRGVYDRAFEELTSTVPFSPWDDSRTVALQQYPAVAPSFSLEIESVRSISTATVVIDGTWRTPGVLAPSGAILPDTVPRGGMHAGTFRLVLERQADTWLVARFAVERP
jgi:hypothetical protein